MDGGVVLRCWEEWLTGAYAGYTVDCLRESEGMLWVGESEHENDKGLDLPDLLKETEGLGTSFDELLTIPEHDDWIYSDGKSTSYVQDAYLVRFFENNSSRLPKWCNDADTVKLPNCQIRGKYRLELPVYNVLDPYPNMNERYPSMPSRYSRIANC
ncbi:hypothetical protein WN943_001223 [Citrus x changshan-huyou]